MSSSSPKDLVILVADKDIEFAVRGLLSRFHSLGIRQPSYDLFVHPRRDPGCLNESPEFLRSFIHNYAHALVMFDREGSGKDALARDRIEEDLEGELRVAGWNDRCSVVVLNPEIEIWVWSDSPHVSNILGWEHRQPGLTDWMVSKGFINPGEVKPARPKEAFQQALRESGTPKSSKLFADLAKKVSLDRCVDASFQKLKDVLRAWFPSA